MAVHARVQSIQQNVNTNTVEVWVGSIYHAYPPPLWELSVCM